MSNRTAENRQILLEWVSNKRREGDDREVTEKTRIIEDGLLSSADVLGLILLIEELGDLEIDATELKPGMFESVEMISKTFLE